MFYIRIIEDKGKIKKIALTILLCIGLTLIASACAELTDAEKQYNAGLEFQEQGKLHEAIAKYDLAIRLDPEYAKAV